MPPLCGSILSVNIPLYPTYPHRTDIARISAAVLPVAGGKQCLWPPFPTVTLTRLPNPGIEHLIWHVPSRQPEDRPAARPRGRLLPPSPAAMASPERRPRLWRRRDAGRGRGRPHCARSGTSRSRPTCASQSWPLRAWYIIRHPLCNAMPAPAPGGADY